MSLSRRRLLAGGGFATLLAAALTLPEILTPDIVADDTLGVYGAARVADTDVAKLNASLLGQLKKANIEIPDAHLFFELDSLKYKVYRSFERGSAQTNKNLGMSQLSSIEGVMQAPRGLQRKYEVLGIPDGVQGIELAQNAVIDYSKDKLLNKGCQCGREHSRIEKDYPAFRVFTALHELVHYIDAKRDISEKIIVGISSREDPAAQLDEGFKSNIQERLADAGAAIYLLSNYGDSLKYLQDVIDYRNASSEPIHYTASTTVAAIKAFGERPRKGLSLIEATEFAEAIISKHPGLISEYKDTADIFIKLYKGTASPDDPRVAKAARARRSLFASEPAI